MTTCSRENASSSWQHAGCQNSSSRNRRREPKSSGILQSVLTLKFSKKTIYNWKEFSAPTEADERRYSWRARNFTHWPFFCSGGIHQEPMLCGKRSRWVHKNAQCPREEICKFCAHNHLPRVCQDKLRMVKKFQALCPNCGENHNTGDKSRTFLSKW